MIRIISAFLLLMNYVHAATVVAQDEDLTYYSDGRVEFKKNTETFGMDKLLPGLEPDSNFNPTILANMGQANTMYKRMRTDYQRYAQCTNMAHVWAYEEYKKSGIKSQKMFVFFTRKYIMKYRFHWWFHVAPMVKVKNQRVVMDRRYTAKAMSPKSWTDHFVKTRRACREVTKYSTYWNNSQNVEDCFLIQGTMYDWQPRDLRYKEKGVEKKFFHKSDLQRAYFEAF